MSIFDKLKDIPGVGVQGPGSKEHGESGPIRQAIGVIGDDLQVRVAKELLKGYNSVVEPPEREPKEKLTDEEKLARSERRSNASKRVRSIGVAGLHLGAGLFRRVADVARKSNSSIKKLPSGEDEEIIDAEFTVLKEVKGDSQNG